MIVLVLFLGMFLLGTMGCTTPPKKEGFTVKLVGMEEQNRGNPVVLRWYQLKKRENFERVDYQDFRKDDDKLLGADLVEWKETTMYPGTKKTLDLQVYTGEGVEYLGVAAFFEDPQGSSWRQVISIKDRDFCQEPWFSDLKVILNEGQILLETRC